MTYVWDSATQDTEAVHNAVRTAGSEVVARVRFADVCCHGTCTVTPVALASTCPAKKLPFSRLTSCESYQDLPRGRVQIVDI